MRAWLRRTVMSLTAIVGMGALVLPQTAAAYNAAAAAAVATGSADCALITPFYWEIGGPSGGPIVGGSVGGVWTRDTAFDLASASKWIFGAYVMERYGGPPPADILRSVQMLSGYQHFNPDLCLTASKVSGCYDLGHAPYANHGYTAAADGTFYYGGGNDQFAAVEQLGMGSLGASIVGDVITDSTLTDEVNSYLHLGPTMFWRYPAIAAGLQSSAADYAAFLQKLMIPHASGGYVMADYLGYNAAGNPTAPCAVSGCSPAGTLVYHYSVNHWVEDNTNTGTELGGVVTFGPGDGSYSSPGAYGFYPWITHDKAFYGIVARHGTPVGFEQSMKCGQEIRAAFLGA